MRSSRDLHHRLGRIASLRALKVMASQGELAEAQAATEKAQARLVEQEREIATKESEVGALLSADALDFGGWRVALAVLENLSANGELIAAETRDREKQEAERREQWRQEYAREEQATALLRKISRRMAEKRDDAAMLEVASLHPRSGGSEA